MGQAPAKNAHDPERSLMSSEVAARVLSHKTKVTSLPSATATAPECPQDQNYCYEQNNRPNPKKNQDAVLVHQHIHATLSVETIESANDPGQRSRSCLVNCSGRSLG